MTLRGLIQAATPGPWRMSRSEVDDEGMPAYTELIGYQLMQHIKAQAKVA
jgi:hypothetical protein